MGSSLKLLRNPHDLFLLLASTMTVLAGATLAPALPGMKEAFSTYEHAELLVKMILSVPGLAVAVFAPFVGRVVDRGDRYKILTVSLLLYGIAGISGYVFDSSLIYILMGRVALGMAVAGVMVSVVAIAGDCFKGPLFGAFMGMQAAFGSFGGVAFLSLSGILAELGWRVPFLIYAFAFVVLTGIWGYRKNEPFSQHTGFERKGSDDFTINRHHALCFVLGFVEVFFLYLIPLHFPFFLSLFGDISSSVSGFSIAGMLCVVALMSMNYAQYARKLPVSQLHALGFVLSAMGFTVLAFAANLYVALFGLFIMGIGFGVLRPNLVVWLFEFTDVRFRGRAMGFMATSYFLAQFLAPLLTQPLIDNLGINQTFLVIAALSLLAGMSILLLPQSEEQKRKQNI